MSRGARGLTLLLALSLSGCVTVGVTMVEAVRPEALHVRECRLTIWTALVATGAQLTDCHMVVVPYGAPGRGKEGKDRA